MTLVTDWSSATNTVAVSMLDTWTHWCYTCLFCLVFAQLHWTEAHAGGPPGEVCAQHTQSCGSRLFLLDSRLHVVTTRRSEAPQGRPSEQDTSC